MKTPHNSHHDVLAELDSASPNFSEPELEPKSDKESDKEKDINNSPNLDNSEEPELETGIKSESKNQEISLETLKQELLITQEKSEQYLDQLRRSQADMENIKQRIKRDAERDIKFALEKFVMDLLPVYDSLERGITEISAGNTSSLESLQKGTELTLEILLKALNKHKVTQINPLGEVFNPELHEAVSMISLPDTPPNTVNQVLQKGYLLNNRLVRPAMVIVTKA